MEKVTIQQLIVEEGEDFAIVVKEDFTPMVEVVAMATGGVAFGSCTKSLFQELDEMQKIQVQLGNKKEMQVEGKGTVGINTDHGKVLNNVQFIPELGYNLLSVGQLMAGGCSLVFDDKKCVITNKKSGQQVHIGMTPNKMFPLDVSTMEYFALAANAKDESELWHLRHLSSFLYASNKKKYGSLYDLQDKVLSVKEKRRVRAFKKGKSYRKEDKVVDVVDDSPSESDIVRNQTLIRSARKKLELDKSLGVQTIGNEDDIVKELVDIELQNRDQFFS
ncbi:hypothetical protein V6N11_042630 [Hibiscus sabdariffa]|uniref:Retrovirus-related Pol polyprotein from transposon TNT 1-94-like beta-barrel domain-containing protein n=1 Tax=Hibiscus sabdariffa TaxID=183260 RepID=A0ABR2QWY5_9ROSI